MFTFLGMFDVGSKMLLYLANTKEVLKMLGSKLISHMLAVNVRHS
jgi:hypothetical protein